MFSFFSSNGAGVFHFQDGWRDQCRGCKVQKWIVGGNRHGPSFPTSAHAPRPTLATLLRTPVARRAQLATSPKRATAVARQGSAVLRASFFERLLEGHVELQLSGTIGHWAGFRGVAFGSGRWARVGR